MRSDSVSSPARDLPDNLPFIRDDSTLRNGTIFTLSTDLGVIDLLAEVSGSGAFQEVKAGSILVQAFDRSVWTLDLPSLIRAKWAAGREKDLRMLPELEGLLEAGETEIQVSEPALSACPAVNFGSATLRPPLRI